MKKRNFWYMLVFCVIFFGGCAETDHVIWISDAETEENLVATENLKETQERISDSFAAESIENLEEDSLREAVIYVYVCGEVNQPGVVILPEGSRANDALKAAGGFSENAQQSAVNLAALLEDGQQLYFPSKEEVVQVEEVKDNLVNLNTADEALLCTLPGIGASRAKDIIAYREKNNGFAKIEDIMNVPGIKEASYEKIKAFITVK